jgi:hypothetical protein
VHLASDQKDLLIS